MCGSAPSAPQLPAYPSLTPDQQTNLGQQARVSGQFGSVIQGTAGQLNANQNILQQISGLFNSDGTINQNAVAQLQQMAGGQTSAAGAAGQQALSGLGGTNAALGATQQAYTSALQGNAPANQQLQYQQQQNFLAMQEQAAQQGIKITGTGFNDAVSDSTAGQKLIQNFQQNANIQNQNYQLGYLGQLGTNMGQLAGVGAQQANTGTGLSQYSQQTPLGYLGQSITGGQSALAPLLSQYQGQLSSAYQPLYMQQIGPYEQQMAQAQANYQGAMGQFNAGQNQMMGWANLGLQGLGAGAQMYAANQNKQGMMALAGV
jgi:hypothetical protein